MIHKPVAYTNNALCIIPCRGIYGGLVINTHNFRSSKIQSNSNRTEHQNKPLSGALNTRQQKTTESVDTVRIPPQNITKHDKTQQYPQRLPKALQKQRMIRSQAIIILNKVQMSAKQATRTETNNTAARPITQTKSTVVRSKIILVLQQKLRDISSSALLCYPFDASSTRK